MKHKCIFPKEIMNRERNRPQQEQEKLLNSDSPAIKTTFCPIRNTKEFIIFNTMKFILTLLIIWPLPCFQMF